MATESGGGGSGGKPEPRHYLFLGKAGTIVNPDWTAWYAEQHPAAPTNILPGSGAGAGDAIDPGYSFTSPTPKRYAVGPDGRTYEVDANGNLVGYTPRAGNGLGLPGGTGPTWYEQQQIALDQQRLADARAAQVAQEKYQAEQAAIARSNLIEGANKDYRSAQLQSTYGTINGMSFGGPKGAPIAQRLPESEVMKDAYAKNNQIDPWSQPALYGGYTGSSYMNSQQPGLQDAMTQVKAPITGTGAPISMAGGGNVPGTTGQPQLIVAHGGENITPAPGTPMPTLLGSPGGAPFSNPLDPNDPQSGEGPEEADSQGDIKSLIANLIKSVQAVLATPEFASLQAPIPGSPDISSGGAPPSMARGGMVPSLALPSTFQSAMPTQPSIPGYAEGGVVPVLKDNQKPSPMVPNYYGQSVPGNIVHAPSYNDVIAGPGTLNPIMGAPGTNQGVLRGLSGFGATVTPNGTPVTMSAYQRQNLMPSSISGPGGYNDYVKQVANWDPADLVNQTNKMMDSGNLTAAKHYAPINIQPAPAGG
jgi:hypothetical protein